MSKLLETLGIVGIEGERSVLGDLRSGAAGALLRIGLSFAGAGFCIACLFLGLGLVEITSGAWVSDELVAAIVCLAGIFWCAMLVTIWWTYRRFNRALRTALGVIVIWLIATPICVWVAASFRREEFMIAGVVAMAIAFSLTLIFTAAYRSVGGRRVRDARGTVHVACPVCGYSMIGLDTCACPECGHRCTIDQLISAQDYEALRQGAPGLETDRVDATAPPDVEVLPPGFLPGTRKATEHNDDPPTDEADGPSMLPKPA